VASNLSLLSPLQVPSAFLSRFFVPTTIDPFSSLRVCSFFALEFSFRTRFRLSRPSTFWLAPRFLSRRFTFGFFFQPVTFSSRWKWNLRNFLNSPFYLSFHLPFLGGRTSIFSVLRAFSTNFSMTACHPLWSSSWSNNFTAYPFVHVFPNYLSFFFEPLYFSSFLVPHYFSPKNPP